MRISGGKAKGIILNVPKGRKLRPVLEPARERLFSSIGPLVKEASFLDLFAGTGSHGLEALSRGAGRGTFVELDALTVACLKKNLVATCKSAELDVSDFEVIKGDALRVIPRQQAPFDIVFADPPYSILESIAPRLFKRLLADDLVGKESLLALGMPGDFENFPEGWSLERRLGKPTKGSPTHGLFRPIP